MGPTASVNKRRIFTSARNVTQTVDSHFSKTVLSWYVQFRCSEERKKKSLVESLCAKLKLAIEIKNATTNNSKCPKNIETKSLRP
jgi:hypothetical protein